MTDLYDVAIVGAGPAGQAAAMRLLDAGLSVCMLDEQLRPGGQILRQPPAEFRNANWMRGALYRDLRGLLDRVEGDSRLTFMGGVSVLGVTPGVGGFQLILNGTTQGELRATRVLVAAGCYDMPVALPGWTLPGVMSAGAVQTLLKAQGVLPGERFVLFGSHPLQLVLAEQLVAAGAQVAAVLFPQSFGYMVRQALPHVLKAIKTPGPLLAAIQSLRSLRKAGVRVFYDAPVIRLTGKGQVSGVEIAHRGESRIITCDIAAMCYGFLPQSDLTRAMGTRMRWSNPAGGWETCPDTWMRSSIPGLYVAGETTGVTGADAAMAEGAIAGLAIATDAGRVDARQAMQEHNALAARRKQLDGFIGMLRRIADPRPWLPKLDPQTLVCRCEDVDAAAVDRAIADALVLSQDFGASAVKLRCRAGMGRCQGRSCEHAIVRRLAAAQRRQPAEVAGFRTRFPARPVAISDLLDE